jgi:hypothetical protein
LDQKDCAVTLLVIIIPSADVILEILAETVNLVHSAVPQLPRGRRAASYAKCWKQMKANH